MHRGQQSRRITAVLFLVMVALLLVPAGASAREPQHQVTAGQTQPKAVSSAARATHPAPAPNVPDRLQLDTAPPPAEPADTPAFTAGAPTSELLASTDGEPAEPTSRGPPAR